MGACHHGYSFFGLAAAIRTRQKALGSGDVEGAGGLELDDEF
jgi:hypothetical protein